MSWKVRAEISMTLEVREMAKLITVRPRFTGPVGGKGLGPVNRIVKYTNLHLKPVFWGRKGPGQPGDTVYPGFTALKW